VGALYTPRTDGAHPGRTDSPAGICCILSSQSLHPAPTSTTRGSA
jgi:hypothetical protein